jgi:hypothetical protein
MWARDVEGDWFARRRGGAKKKQKKKKGSRRGAESAERMRYIERGPAASAAVLAGPRESCRFAAGETSLRSLRLCANQIFAASRLRVNKIFEGRSAVAAEPRRRM